MWKPGGESRNTKIVSTIVYLSEEHVSSLEVPGRRFSWGHTAYMVVTT